MIYAPMFPDLHGSRDVQIVTVMALKTRKINALMHQAWIGFRDALILMEMVLQMQMINAPILLKE